jgi:hypothetical protein
MSDSLTSVRSGYEAMGLPVPAHRLSAAYRHVKAMVPGISTEEAMSLVGRVADRLERDDPYGALREATEAAISKPVSSATPSYTPRPGVRLDVTGGYRLLAVLLNGEAGDDV